MHEVPRTKEIYYQDQNHNFYRPIPPTDLPEEETMRWFPFLSPPDMTAIPNGTTSFSEQEAARLTHSHPPGFEPKVLPQTIDQGNQAGYTGYPVKGLQIQMPGTLSIPMSHDHPMPTYKGSNGITQ